MQNKSFEHFSIAPCIQITKIVLIQFPDDFYAKHQAVVKMKVDFFMEVFEDDYLPLWMIIVDIEDMSSVDGDYPF